MLKRWAALPARIQWLAGTAAAVLGLAVVGALFVPLADRLARQDVGSAGGSCMGRQWITRGAGC